VRVGSLFSGYGGLDTAVAAYFCADLAWWSEVEPAACRVMESHHPGVPNLGDITAVNWDSVPPVDILTGGYPCQPFSTAGHRKGTHDDRHLWPYVRDAIRAVRPRVVVLENVRGHLSLGFDVVLSDLAALGMSARWGVVRASDAGAPHNRERLFIVAHPGGGQLPGPAERRGLPVPPERGPAPSDPEGSERGATEPDDLREAPGSAAEPRERASNAADATGGRWVWTERQSEQLQGTQGKPVQRLATNSGQGTAWGAYAAAVRRWESVTGRPAPAPTVQRNGRDRLSPVFVEWMMGLPEGWVTGHGLSPSQELKMLGNGVVPQQAALALSLLGVD